MIFSERFSCRSFDRTRKIESDVLNDILEAARLAPSACNRQPWTFLIVDNEAGREAIRQSYNRDWITTAPLYIIAFGHHDVAWHRPFDNKDHTDIDLAIAIEHICLSATKHGIGTCWVCNFDPVVIRNAFKTNDNTEPIAIIPIGYPAENIVAPQKVRKPLNEIVKWNEL